MGYLFDPDNWEWVTSGNNLRFLLEGFLINLEIAAIAMVFSLIFGLLLALGRLSKLRPLSLAAGVWVDVWRNLPLIFIILYIFLAAPESWAQTWEDVAPGFLPEALRTGRVFAGLLALVLYNSAVIAEIMRAGILSLPRGQSEAALALGLGGAGQVLGRLGYTTLTWGRQALPSLNRLARALDRSVWDHVAAKYPAIDPWGTP
jgi:His/Glu/Gln/Arg/opine family amino acid ABC transporter permease subunit